MRASEHKRILGPFPPYIFGPGVPCYACKQRFAHSTPAGKYPAFLVDLQKYPDFDFSDYPGVEAACALCWRPLNGAKDNLIPHPSFGDVNTRVPKALDTPADDM